MLRELDIIKEKAPILAIKYKLDLMVVFGSYALGKVKKTSDLDIAVLGDISFEQELQLAEDLKNLTKVERVDLVNLNNSSPLLKRNATTKGILIYEKNPGLFSTFRMSSFFEYVETAPLRTMSFLKTKNYINFSNPIRLKI
ncbi:hypothetical protein A3C57_00865 [Candidatus Nomurabacteria bacterium RIFCSPHIGHO2_02_FULL_33_12]|uniref:Polymerase beta nucleotidyltransferase domain-containing protein n=1 Tax=Candidatus Nomurabacteria bacterium RIFCSPLOWO2_01_FULL_33_17 TaxID=1801764 RepID=A0A1F6WMQ3_9BACT|nr:MAG: hypothetical protein A3C57_00865 [Candidatus Nomurabacteria bacterium RIFCSPHIGHO2_02_FULL_33_12]OGI83192.1 MAG: hypothetical protein A2903_02685 [Candidatus Nomurabacteria bacterium RIFCSPLOWO2_01_FULL_33_17]